MTMVLPFALALAVGGYCLFFFLYAYATLLSFPPQFVKSVLSTGVSQSFVTDAHRRINKSSRCDGVDSPLTMTVTMTTARFIWDPGGNNPYNATLTTHLIALTNTTAIATTRVRAWDPGSLVATMASLVAPFALAVRGYLLIFLSIYATSCSLYPARAKMVTVPRYHDKTSVTVACPPATASLFHYSHPVLSRPTVPNIDS